MKRITLLIMAFIGILSLLSFSKQDDPSKWSSKQIDKWFEKGDWLNGWKVTPDPSIDRKTFAISYFKYKSRWDKAFTFLKTNDLTKLELKKLELDGANLFVSPSEYTTKNPEDANFEAHRKYIDIQYVVSGKEQIGIAPLTSAKAVVTPYDATKDVEFLTYGETKNYKASPERFFIFFPSDAHRPNLKDGENSKVRKVVVKVKVD